MLEPLDENSLHEKDGQEIKISRLEETNVEKLINEKIHYIAQSMLLRHFIAH